MARGDAVHGVGVARDLDRLARQLLPKSYRARSAAQRRRGQRRDPPGELLGRAQRRAPAALAAGSVERGGDLAAAGVENGEPVALPGGLAEPAGERVERPHPAQREAAAQAQRPAGGDADAQPGEGAGADADGEPADGIPAPGRGRRPLDLGEQRRGVLRAALLGEPERGLEEQLLAAQRGDRRVLGRGVEADQGRRGATCRAYGCPGTKK
jgi:hypothetical protein